MTAPISKPSDGQRFWLIAVEPVVELDLRRAQVRRLAPAAAIDVDQRVRLLRARRKDAARPVILERAPDEMNAVGQQRRGQRIAGKPGHVASVET